MVFHLEQVVVQLQQIQTHLPPELGLDPDAIAPIPPIHWFDHLDSTNAQLWRLLGQEPVPDPNPEAIVLAGEQQTGRGQWGRHWVSHLGGLYLSWSCQPHLAADRSFELTLCSAWGVATLLRHFHIPVALKWPNDLVCQGRKLGGILTETRIQSGTIHRAIVGIGVNWQNPVPPTGITLGELSDQPIASLEQLAAIVIAGLRAGYYRWQSGGMTALLPPYLALLTNLGQSVELNGRIGTVVGVEPTGALRVRFSDPGVAPAPDPAWDVQIPPGSLQLGYVGTLSP